MLFYSVAGTFKSHHKLSKKKKRKNKKQSKKVANSVIDMPWVGKGFKQIICKGKIFFWILKESLKSSGTRTTTLYLYIIKDKVFFQTMNTCLQCVHWSLNKTINSCFVDSIQFNFLSWFNLTENGTGRNMGKLVGLVNRLMVSYKTFTTTKILSTVKCNFRKIFKLGILIKEKNNYHIDFCSTWPTTKKSSWREPWQQEINDRSIMADNSIICTFLLNFFLIKQVYKNNKH